MKIRSSVLVLMSLALAGCGSTLQERAIYQSEAKGAAFGAASGALVGGLADGGAPMGAAVGGIIGGAVGQFWYSKNIAQLTQAIREKGGQIFILGDKVRVILPTDSLFDPSKDKLKWNAETTLVALSDYLKQFGRLCITISGYTDSMPNRVENKKLSTLRAQRIASFLWAQGFEAEYLQVIGHGQEQPIASNETIVGRSFNRRIEITLWQGI